MPALRSAANARIYLTKIAAQAAMHRLAAARIRCMAQPRAPLWRARRERCGEKACLPGREHSLALDERDHCIQPRSDLEIRERERCVAAHPARIAFHHLERRADVRGEVGLVDDEQIGAR